MTPTPSTPGQEADSGSQPSLPSAEEIREMVDAYLAPDDRPDVFDRPSFRAGARWIIERLGLLEGKP